MTSFKFVRLAIATAAAAASLSSAPAFAADSTNLTVNATVSGICKLTAPAPLAFTLDPSSGSAGSASTAVTYRCTKNTASGTFAVGGASGGTYTSGATQALGALAGGTSTDLIPYTITWTPPSYTGTGFTAGSAKSVTLTGSIAYAAFADVAADTYTNTVAITITP